MQITPFTEANKARGNQNATGSTWLYTNLTMTKTHYITLIQRKWGKEL